VTTENVPKTASRPTSDSRHMLIENAVNERLNVFSTGSSASGSR
jgi:hypothetical protein